MIICSYQENVIIRSQDSFTFDIINKNTFNIIKIECKHVTSKINLSFSASHSRRRSKMLIILWSSIISFPCYTCEIIQFARALSFCHRVFPESLQCPQGVSVWCLTLRYIKTGECVILRLLTHTDTCIYCIQNKNDWAWKESSTQKEKLVGFGALWPRRGECMSPWMKLSSSWTEWACDQHWAESSLEHKSPFVGQKESSQVSWAGLPVPSCTLSPSLLPPSFSRTSLKFCFSHLRKITTQIHNFLSFFFFKINFLAASDKVKTIDFQV